MSLKGARFRWAFGSLADGTASPALRPDQLELARNIEHDKQGSVSKRRGMREITRVAAVAENAVAPVLSDLGATAGSTLGNGTLYVRLTYSTVAGETDDLHSTEGNIATTAGNGYRCWLPFHIFARAVQVHENAGTSMELESGFTDEVLSNFAADTFNGYYVYSREPALQDETALGVNVSNRKLWDRTNFLAKILDYADGVFTLDRALPFSLAGSVVDILMPDRGGLPIRAVNVYVSSDDVTYYFYDSYAPTTSVMQGRPHYVDITSIPSSNRQSPATRLTRAAPSLAAVDATDTEPNTGIVRATSTGLRGGVYQVRHTWNTKSAVLLDSTGWPENAEFSIPPRQRLSTQEAWPSRAGLVAIGDGQGITVTPPTIPAGVESYNVYAKRVEPDTTLTFNGVTNPSSTHRAYVYPSETGVGFVNDVSNFSSILALSPAAFRALLYVMEFPTSDTVYGGVAAITASYDGLAASDSDFVRQKADYDGVNEYLGKSTNCKYQFEFQLSGGQQASTTYCALVVRLKCVKNNAYHGLEGTGITNVSPEIRIRRRRSTAATWVTLESGITEDALRTYVFGFAHANADLEGGRHVFDIAGLNGLEPYIDSVFLELYEASVATDPAVTSAEVMQEREIREPSVTLKSALVPAARGLAIPANTTGQWPCTVYTNFVQNYKGGPETAAQTMVGCADSVFCEKDGALVRVYQQDGESGITTKATLEVTQHDWQFDAYLSRVFFVNQANDLGYNLRFDGVQTHAWGLEKPTPEINTTVTPPDGEDTEDNDDIDPNDPWGCARFNVNEQWRTDIDQNDHQSWTRTNEFGGDYHHEVNVAKYPRWVVRDPEGGRHEIYDYRLVTLGEARAAQDYGSNLLIGQVFEGTATGRGTGGATRITRVVTEYTEDIIHCLLGDAPPEPTTETPDDEGVQEGEYDFYVVHLRKLEGPSTDGRGYVVRSEPALGKTINVTEGSRITLLVGPPKEPQVTHLELYRNLRGTADYFLVDTVEVTQGGLEDGYIRFVTEATDDDIAGAQLINFETGRPAAASTVRSHKNRMWFVPLFNKSAVCFTNLTSVSGDVDPEGWYPFNSIVPTMKRQGSITAIAPYNDTLVVFSESGVSQVSGIGDDLNSANPISSVGLFAEAGAIGPNAWCEVDGLLFFMSKLGPSILAGQTVTYIGALVEGTVSSMNRGANAAKFMRCLHRRTQGVSQIWFTFSDRTDGRPDSALVFDLNIGPGMEEDRRLWAGWTELYAHGCDRSRDALGEEMVVIGDHWGRVHQYGKINSDNGIFIDAEIKTAPVDVGNSGGRSFRPRRLILLAKGRNDDYIHIDVYKDLGGDARNIRPMRVDMGGDGTAVWGDAGALWGAGNTPGVWGGAAGTGYKAHNVHLGGTYHHIQFHHQQVWADMPPGTRRDATFELAGYDMTFEPLGYRRREP